ncbi:DLA class II histocompatibility antigen, DR-1 beta chain-like isoform 2-T2 [Pangshura tecta]
MTPGGVPGVARNCWAGALIVAIALRTHRAHCIDPPEHFLLQEKSECHYTNGMQQVRYLKRLIWGQQEICYYDSDLGFSVARTELGRPIAEYWNRLEWLSYLWASVEKFCSYNHRRFKNITVGRQVSKWFKNGQEETAGVISRELLHNGDWTFQIQVTLETRPRWGDVYTCQVEHISLQTPITKQWVAQPDSAKSKMFIGIGGFVLGLIFMVLGLLIYQKNKKGYLCLDTADSQAGESDRGSSTNLLLCA